MWPVKVKYTLPQSSQVVSPQGRLGTPWSMRTALHCPSLSLPTGPVSPATPPRRRGTSRWTAPAPTPSAISAELESSDRPAGQTGKPFAVDSYKTRTYGSPAYPTTLGRIKKNPHPQSHPARPSRLDKTSPRKGAYSTCPVQLAHIRSTPKSCSIYIFRKKGGRGGSTT